jgi:recombination protein RecA
LIGEEARTYTGVKANKKRNYTGSLMPLTARAELESLLRLRKLDVTLTSMQPWEHSCDVAPTGVSALDEPLGGGLRRGHVSEIVGDSSSGRTRTMCRILAAAAGRGEAVALVDTCDRFDPASAAAAGLDLSMLLWVRVGGPVSPRAGAASRAGETAGRALKAVNLVLQAGGFGVVVFDLADVAAIGIRQFPYTTWARLARVIEGSQTVALVVAAEHVARSPGGVTVALDGGGRRAEWSGTGERARLLRRVDTRTRIVSARQLPTPQLPTPNELPTSNSQRTSNPDNSQFPTAHTRGS